MSLGNRSLPLCHPEHLNLPAASWGRNNTVGIAMDARPGGPTAKRQPSPEGLGNRCEDEPSAVGAPLNRPSALPVSLGTADLPAASRERNEREPWGCHYHHHTKWKRHPPLCHPERTRISCHAALEKTACAPFRREMRMKFASATKFNRKSGSRGICGLFSPA
jgi:hypothetical protein